MDLSQYEQQDTCEYTLIAPDGDKTDVVFTLAGPTHPTRAAFEKRQAKRGLRDFNKKGKASLPDDPDDLLEQQIARVVAFTLNWKNLAIGSNEIKYSPKAAQELYSDEKFAWIRDAVNGELANVANFMRSSSMSSSLTPSTTSAST